MMTTSKKLQFTRWLTALVCFSLTLPLLAGGGGGGGGGGGRGGGGGGGFGGGGAGGGGGGTGSANSAYPQQGQVAPVTFTIDPISGSVIYITSEANNDAIVTALKGLDRPHPQVLIKVVFLEVTYNNGIDIGLEGGISHSLNGSQVLSFTNLFGLANQGISATPGVTTLPGASFLTLTGDNFAATLRAIQEKGKVEILSRPTILARQAQPATIVIGQNVPLITGIIPGTLGSAPTSQITYTPVGIILNVTPFIYPNGDVEMILNPQISEVSAQSTQISTGTNGNFSTPYINTRSANTVVVTPNGQTVVIGGLMQDSKTVTDSQIPFLGSIPILGNMFKHKVYSTAKTELMIFVTPTVVQTPADLARMSVDETSRTKISTKAFNQSDRDRYIDAQSPVAPAGASSEVAHPVTAPVH